MKKRAFSLLTMFFCFLAAPSLSGSAIDEPVKCPIGGPRVTVVSTTSCSTGPRVTMSLRRPSSCDFVTRLPVCAKEDFPVYRDFSKEEKRQLKRMVKEEWYQAARSKSRYLRAYLVEQKLETMSEEEVFWLLQGGHFYDPENTYGSEEYYAVFREVANSYISVAPDESKKLVLLMAAFARIQLGKPEKARSMLSSASQYKTPDTPFYDQYLNAVKACLNSPDAKKCRPDYEFEILR